MPHSWHAVKTTAWEQEMLLKRTQCRGLSDSRHVLRVGPHTSASTTALHSSIGLDTVLSFLLLSMSVHL